MATVTTAYQLNITDKNGVEWDITLQDSRLNTSANYWNNAYSALTATSGNWNKSYTALTATSGHWNKSYTALTATSGHWNKSYTALTATSGHWNDAYAGYISGVALGATTTTAAITNHVALIPSASNTAAGLVVFTLSNNKITKINNTAIKDVDTGVTAISAVNTDIVTTARTAIIPSADKSNYGLAKFLYNAAETHISAINAKLLAVYPTITSDANGVVTFSF